MRAAELKGKGALYVENIQQGFEDCAYEVLSFGNEEAKDLFLELRRKNGEENSFLDFYYFALSREEKERIDCLLNQDEIQYLKEYEKSRLTGDTKEDIIFPMEDMLLEIAVKLNEKSALFSTMYFLKEKSTWWGNYERNYVKFWEK